MPRFVHWCVGVDTEPAIVPREAVVLTRNLARVIGRDRSTACTMLENGRPLSEMSPQYGHFSNAVTRLDADPATVDPGPDLGGSKRTYRPIFKKGIRRSATSRRTKTTSTPSHSATLSMSSKEGRLALGRQPRLD